MTAMSSSGHFQVIFGGINSFSCSTKRGGCGWNVRRRGAARGGGLRTARSPRSHYPGLALQRCGSEAARDRLNDGRRVGDVLAEGLIAAGVDRVDHTRRRRPPAWGNTTMLPDVQPRVGVLLVYVCRAPLRARAAVRDRA